MKSRAHGSPAHPSSLLLLCWFGLLSAALRLPAQTAPAAAGPQDQIVELSPFTVSTTGDVGYGTTAGLGGTRINMPVMDSDMSITSINKEQLADMGFINLADTLHYVSGMGNSRAFADGGYTFRGNQNNGSNFRDGIPELYNIGGTETVDSATFDRIEVIKGPAGVLFGSMGIGGTVNRISKLPLPIDHTEVSFSYGTVHLSRTDLDLTKTLIAAKDSKLAFRLAGAWQKGKWFDGGPNNRLVVNPSIEYTTDNEEKMWLYYVYQYTEVPQSLTIPADRAGNLFPGLDQHSPGNPNDRRFNYRHNYEWGYSKNFQILDADSSVRFVARYVDQYQVRKADGIGVQNVFSPNGTLLGTDATVLWSQVDVGSLVYTYLRDGDSRTGYKGGTASADFASTFDLLGGRNRFFMYGQATDERNYNWEIFTQPIGSTGSQPYLIGGIQEWPVLTIPANWEALNMAEEAAGSFTQNSNNTSNDTDTAFAAQDNISFLKDRLIVVGGLRFDNVLTNTRDFLNVDSAGNPTATLTEDGAWSKKYGAVIKPIPGIAIYYNHSTTFTPVYSLDTNPISPTFGQKFPDSQGLVNEGGVRGDLYNSRIVGSVVYYSSAVTNQLLSVFPPNNVGLTGQSYLQPIGTITDKGVEVDLALSPIKSITLIASSSNSNPRLANGTPALGVPTETVAYFGKFSFPSGPLEGFSIAGGYQYASNRKISVNPVVRLPNYHLSNLNLIYIRSHWRFQVDIDNLFDQKEATGYIAINRISLYPYRNFTTKVTWMY